MSIDDLDTEESVESLFMSSVTGEDAKERSDRQTVTPWLKLLWETYRHCLDLLKNHNRLEILYHVCLLAFFFVYFMIFFCFIILFFSVFHLGNCKACICILSAWKKKSRV
jgi:hypothetical protein